MQGLRVKQLKANLGGLTQMQLANLVGVSYHTVKVWETGRRKPKVDNLICLYDHGVNIEWLTGHSDTFTRPGFTENQVRESVKAVLDSKQAAQAQ